MHTQVPVSFPLTKLDFQTKLLAPEPLFLNPSIIAKMPNRILLQALVALTIAGFLFIFWRLSRIARREKDYPPGPPTIPVVGNLHQIPPEKRHWQFGKWAREYGSIFSLMLGTQTWIVLSADYAIRDLVDKRGPIYASRPDLYIAQHIVSGGLRVLFMVCL